MQRAIERVRGFSDVDASTLSRSRMVVDTLERVFTLAGFAMIDVPVLEHIELYVRKNGAEVLEKLYGFTDQGRREVALRPEFTASVIRSIGPSASRALEPTRVSYAGPVFRYEKPQRATSRQFTQAGVELLGAAGPGADAEILALACDSAHECGVGRLHLVLGHLGPLRALLAHLKVDGYAEGYLLEHLEYYNRGHDQQQQVRHRLGIDAHVTDMSQGEDLSYASLAEALAGLSPEAARGVVNGLLRQMGVDLAGNTRTPDEIIERVLDKAQRQSALRLGARRENLERALQFCSALSDLRGEPETVLRQAEALLRAYDVPLGALDEIRLVVEALHDHDLGNTQVTLAPGMARGIAYYSGLIFELYATPAEGASAGLELQICGGGRYDGLPLALTGKHEFPALGFAFGVERMLHCLPGESSTLGATPKLAIAVGRAPDRRLGFAIAAEARHAGFPTVVHLADTADSHLRDRLKRAGYGALVFVRFETSNAQSQSEYDSESAGKLPAQSAIQSGGLGTLPGSITYADLRVEIDILDPAVPLTFVTALHAAIASAHARNAAALSVPGAAGAQL